ncbi:hypothetical protein DENSPDRAFT_772513 [Dentipellis sp. KUC8613]|nr:hypothetical protein DENSPDRAFT_772513 [Dentipellis sp. KUC8613]
MHAFQPVLNGTFGEDAHPDRPSQSSPTTTSGSSYPSHTSSPAIPGMTTAFSAAPPSIASTLNPLGVNISRSRSGSLASAGHFLGTAGELGLSSAGSGPPTSSQGSGFHYSPQAFESQATVDKESSPEIPGGPHLMVVGDMLQNIVRTANSARQACSMGQSATAGVKIDELKKTIALVSDLIAATRLGDGPSPPGDPASPPQLTAASTRASPPHLTAMAGSNAHHQQQLSLGSTQGSLEPLEGPDSSESRKRCASSLGGDRVIKALKLEPQDDLTLQSTSTVAFPFSPPPTAGSAEAHPFPSNPPSRPASRPGSSSGLTSTGIPLHHLFPSSHPQSQHSNPVPINFPPPLNLSNATPRQSLDFNAPASQVAPPHANLHPPPPMPSFGHPPEPQSAWPGQQVMFGQQPQQHVPMQTSPIGGGNIEMPGPPPYPPPSSYSPTTAHPASGQTFDPPMVQDVNPAHLTHPPPIPSQPVEPFAYNIADPPSTIDERPEYRQSRPSTAISPGHTSGSSPDQDYDNDDRDSDAGGEYSQSQSPPSRGEAFRSRVGSIDNGPGGAPSAYTQAGGQRRPLASRPSVENFSAQTAGGHGNEVPQEYRAEVDRIFFEFLNKTCSNLDATDAKGEPIHQTLMAKKMQRLDESPDFRPFKFRIQAFTNAFLEELAKQGYPEDKIPMKKIRNYLWNSSYISRFNEDGKKAKSKGNHIWNIEAKKAPEGGWIFRPFHRRLAGLPPGVAYVGLRWSWTPRIWDPQASRSNLPVQYTSPSLPSWLSWQDDTLSGIPTPDSQSSDVTVEARFMQDGQEEFLSQTVHINIAPMSNVDTTFSTSRRPSLVGDGSLPRRIASDSVVPLAGPTRATAVLRTPANVAPAPPVPSQDAQVIQVLTTAAQRVAQEAQSQVVAARIPSEPGPELQALAKQQHVLTVTAQAVDKTVSGQGAAAAEPSSVLAAAAQQVVLQAARQVAADHSAVAAAQMSAGLPPTPSSSSQVTVNEVSVATQSAVAQAVEIAGPLSSEVDVLMTASSLLQQQSRAAPIATAPALDPTRPHSTGTILPRSFASGGGSVPAPAEPGFFPPNPPPIPPLDLPIYPSHA